MKKTSVKKTTTSKAGKTTKELDNLRSMFAAMNKVQGIIEFNLDGTIITANEAFCKVVNYSLDEIKGKHHSMFCDEEYVKTDEYRDFWKKLNQGQFDTGEYHRFGKNKKDVFIIASYNPVFDDNGKLYKVVKFATDVTESKRELKVLNDIINTTSIVSVADLKGNIVSCNDKYCEVSQYSREEAIGKGHNLTRHPDVKKEVFKELWSTIGKGNIFRGVIKNQAKDGSPYYVDAVIAPVLGDNGKPKKYIGVRYDITSLELEKQQSQGILNAIDSSYAFAELDKNGKFLKVNKIFSDLLNYSKEELVGKEEKMVNDPAYTNSGEFVKVWDCLNNGRSYSGIFKKIKKNGETVWFQTVYSPVLDEVGRVVKFVSIASDITALQKVIETLNQSSLELNQNAEELKQNAQMMNKNAQKTLTQAESSSASTEQVYSAVQTVAASTEEMVASIREISRSSNESAEMSKFTLNSAVDANRIIQQLGTSSEEIGNVIKVISSIAQQTNLLALNATIEAARAGDAGKGFAVVANEVKELAKQTAKATEEITNKINTIQKDAKEAVNSIGNISTSMEKLNTISGALAAAVDEQTATTNEVSRVIGESRKGVETINQNIKEVSTAAEESAKTGEVTLQSAETLAKISQTLKEALLQIKR